MRHDMTRRHTAWRPWAAALAAALVCAPLHASGDDGKKEEPASAAADKRMVGTSVWAPRSDVQRSGSALELMTPELIAIRDKAMTYIKNSQHANGGWGDKEFEENAGVSALCCLAMLSEGNLPRIGPSGIELNQGVEFLLDQCKSDGQIASKSTYRYGPMYGHTWATLVLLQVYGNIPWRMDMRDKMAKAIEILLNCQKVDGGWRYTMMKEGESDTLVTLNVILSLRAGMKAGFVVPAETLGNAAAYIEKNGMPDGQWFYKPGGTFGSPAVSACGNIAIYGTGRFEDSMVVMSRNFIRDYYNRLSVDDILDSEFPFYRMFYTSIAMYQSGDEYWIPYFKKITEVFKKGQKEDGQFENQRGNTVYPTACALVVMQAPFGYLPFYYR